MTVFKKFNEHPENMFIPSSRICVDESISRWYSWINIGLLMYVAIDRKSENGCEIQDAACGTSGIMISLRVVKTSNEGKRNNTRDRDDGQLHGTKVLLELVDK